MGLRFANRRRIEGLDYENPVERDRVWLDRDALTPCDQAQLLTNLLTIQLYDDLTTNDVWQGNFAFFWEHFDGVAETPLEGWDVVDETSGEVRFQLWLGWVDHGVLVEAGTTNEVGGEGIIQGYWHGDPELGSDLEAARASLRASRQYPDSLVIGIRFKPG